MKYRTVTLHAEEDLDASGTKTIAINVKDPISALIFPFRVTFSTGAMLLPMQDAISKIELVDGSDVLMALSGSEMAGVSFYEGEKRVNCTGSNLQSVTLRGHIRANFGRFLRDPMLALVPDRFRNLQLKVTYDVTDVQALASDLYLAVLAECFDEKAISPIGFLQNRELHSYVGGATTYEYIDVPTDLVIRKLLLQTKNFGAAHFQNLTSMKLSEDNDKRIPFDISVYDLMDACLREFGDCSQYLTVVDSGTGYPAFVAPCNVESAVVVNGSRQEVVQIVAMTGGKIAYAGATGTSWMYGTARGSLPYFVHCIPFGDQKDIDDWYDPKDIGSLRLRVESGANGASCTFNTILQQLRRY